MTVSLLCCKKFSTLKKVIKVKNNIFTSVIGLGLNELVMWGLMKKLAMYYMLAKIVATIVVMIWNYIAKRKVVTSNAENH